MLYFELRKYHYCDTYRKGDFLTNLSKYRKMRHLTQLQLACMTGLNKNTIALYEQGQRDINKASADIVRRLSNVLSCNMEDIMEDDNDSAGEENI